MYNTMPKYLFMIITAGLILWTGSLGVSDSCAQEEKGIKPFSGPVINPEEAKPFKLTATIMEINKGRISNMVIAEELILVTEYKLGYQVKNTQLVGDYGQTLTLKDFKKGQRVVVNGLQLIDGTRVGERIQVKDKRK